MNNLNEKLSEALAIQPLEIKQSTEIVEIKDVVDDDAEFARQNIRDLIVKGNDAASHIVEIAKQSEHPRAFEVAAGMLKNLSDMNKDLLEIQKRKQDFHFQRRRKNQQIVHINQNDKNHIVYHLSHDARLNFGNHVAGRLQHLKQKVIPHLARFHTPVHSFLQVRHD